MPDLAWPTAATAKTDFNISATQAQLDTAREECLRAVGLSLSTPVPPSASFREGVSMQALANQQATQADAGDWTGSEDNGVRLYPLSKKIRAKLIVPAPIVPGSAFEPAVAAWPTGEQVHLSRVGDVVTATVTNLGATLPTAFIPFPADYFRPAGKGQTTQLSALDTYVLIVRDRYYALDGIGLSPSGPGPFADMTVTWLGDPADGNVSTRDAGLVRSLIG